MIYPLLHQLHDPMYAAIPVFFAFIAIEAVVYKFDRDEAPAGRGYSAADFASMTMGLGALTAGLAFRAASLVAYTALYVYAAPWHAPADQVADLGDPVLPRRLPLVLLPPHRARRPARLGSSTRLTTPASTSTSQPPRGRSGTSGSSR